MKRFAPLLLAASLAWFTLPLHAGDLVVIVHPQSGVDRLSREDVINIFLGRFRQFSSGISAQPLDLPAQEKEEFYQRLVGKDLAEINAYWARLIFSGATAPPRQMKGIEQVLNAVAASPAHIGYVERNRVDGRVRIVHELNR